MAERTFGWVQDPSKISNLRLVVEIFDPESKTHNHITNTVIPKIISEQDGKNYLIEELNKKPLKLKYRDLVGTAFKPRASARCNGIIQATIKGQKRLFISDWPADNFLRWAVSLGFIDWDEKTDKFSISQLGLLLSQTKIDSKEEYKIYEKAFLSYPPVSRIINLLAQASENNYALTKFEIGKNLGFIGEEGFTSISQNLFVKEIVGAASQKDRAEIKSNWEGDADKYARMICSWLMQLKNPWVEKVKKTINVNFIGNKYSYDLQAYTITKEGYEIRKKILGASKFQKVSKIVYFEMLATKGRDRKYLRTRRAYIIEFITKQSLTLEEIQSKLNSKGFPENLETIKDDINGLNNIGLSISKIKNKYYCLDKIVGLNIPILEVRETHKSDILELMEKCREKIRNIPHEYLVLIPMSFDKNKSTLFEIKTIELLTEYCKFDGLHLGGVNKPDGIIYSNDYGVIIDTKSYENGFNIPVSERDKMKRYIEENQNRNPKHNKTIWWDNFPKHINEFLFLFISGKFVGNFSNQLKILSEQTKNTLGGGLPSYVLLNLADQIVGDKINHCDFKNKISCLEEIVI